MKKTKAKGINGERFEELVGEKFNLNMTKDPTHKWDAYTQDGVPVSIKSTEGRNNVVFGDIFRQAYMKEEGFWLVVGLIDVNKDVYGNVTKTLRDVYVMAINADKWRGMFDKNLMEKYETFIKAWCKVQVEKEDIVKPMWNKYRDEFRDKWAEVTDNVIRPRPRWQKATKDSDGNMVRTNRIQCEMRHKDLLDNFINNDEVKKTAIYSGEEFLNRTIKKKKKSVNIKITEDFKKQTKVTEISIEDEEYLEELRKEIRFEEMNLHAH